MFFIFGSRPPEPSAGSHLRQMLTELRLEIQALPPEQQLQAVFVNLFIYVADLEGLHREVGKLRGRLDDLAELIAERKELLDVAPQLAALGRTMKEREDAATWDS